MDYKQLASYEAHLTQAKGGYVRDCPQALLDIAFAEYAIKYPQSGLQKGCSSCVMRALVYLANEYFKSKQPKKK